MNLKWEDLAAAKAKLTDPNGTVGAFVVSPASKQLLIQEFDEPANPGVAFASSFFGIHIYELDGLDGGLVFPSPNNALFFIEQVEGYQNLFQCTRAEAIEAMILLFKKLGEIGLNETVPNS